jgi:hypothetical protein
MNPKSIFTSLTLITLCIVGLLAAWLLWPRATGFDNQGNLDRRLFPAGEELRQGWQLAPDAQVRVKDIAGNLTIETHDADIAEVYAERAATRRPVLSELPLTATYQPATDATPESLTLANPTWQKQVARIPRPMQILGVGRSPEFRERVVIKLPRRVNLLISHVQGDVTIGVIDGIVRVLNTDGSVCIAQATEVRQLVGIKGSLEATLTKLGPDLQVAGIGGPVKLHFRQEPDTRIRGDFVLGAINAQLPGFRVTEKRFFRFQGETGKGVSLIKLFNIRNSVTLDFSSEPQLAKTPASR